MKYAQLELYVSQPRLNRFLRACGNSKSKAQKLYKINLRVAQAFYPVMNLFEIFLRNALNNQLALHFNDHDWIINQKPLFMSHLSLAPSRYFLRGCVLKAESKIRPQPITSGKIISEQTLGFWTALFDNHHYILLHGSIMAAFPNKSAATNRSAIATKLKNIREFRNRIYHNEPICFRGNSVDFSAATQILSDVHDVIGWIDPNLLGYTEYFNNVNDKINLANTL
ncbi:hypothetical protein [Pedobacter planticolens]|uniref:hypothetical protein n=1 Tax=Pedobacter planticolens TaxID=2679964 RepID=UPI0016023EE2|nr:hypothetical protein [Pedobacter planticolens]